MRGGLGHGRAGGLTRLPRFRDAPRREVQGKIYLRGAEPLEPPGRAARFPGRGRPTRRRGSFGGERGSREQHQENQLSLHTDARANGTRDGSRPLRVRSYARFRRNRLHSGRPGREAPRVARLGGTTGYGCAVEKR